MRTNESGHRSGRRRAVLAVAAGLALTLIAGGGVMIKINPSLMDSMTQSMTGRPGGGSAPRPPAPRPPAPAPRPPAPAPAPVRPPAPAPIKPSAPAPVRPTVRPVTPGGGVAVTPPKATPVRPAVTPTVYKERLKPLPRGLKVTGPLYRAPDGHLYTYDRQRYTSLFQSYLVGAVVGNMVWELLGDPFWLPNYTDSGSPWAGHDYPDDYVPADLNNDGTYDILVPKTEIEESQPIWTNESYTAGPDWPDDDDEAAVRRTTNDGGFPLWGWFVIVGAVALAILLVAALVRGGGSNRSGPRWH